MEAIKTAVQCGLGAAFVSACAIQKELDLGLVSRVDIAGVRLARGVLLVSNPHRAQPHATSQASPIKILSICLLTGIFIDKSAGQGIGLVESDLVRFSRLVRVLHFLITYLSKAKSFDQTIAGV